MINTNNDIITLNDNIPYKIKSFNQPLYNKITFQPWASVPYINIPDYVNTLVGCILDAYGFSISYAFTLNNMIYIYNYMQNTFEVNSGTNFRVTLIYN